MKALEYPKQLPKLPSLESLKGQTSPGELFEKFKKEHFATMEHNEALFEQHLKRMRLCNLINAMLNRPISAHFSWCPHPIWKEYWQEQGWPELPV